MNKSQDTETYTTVAKDTMIHTMLGISLYYSTQVDKWETAQLLDVEVAFLNAPLPKSVYIELPDLFYEYCKSR